MDKGLAFRRIDGVWICACGDSLWALEKGVFRQKLWGIPPGTLPLPDMAEDLSRNGVGVTFTGELLLLEPPADWPMPRVRLLLERAETWLRQAGRTGQRPCIRCGQPGLPRVEGGEAVWLCRSCSEPALPCPPEEKPGLWRRIGDFFRRIFRR